MEQNFSWDKSAVEYVRLYSEIIGVDYQTQLDVRPEAIAAKSAPQPKLSAKGE
jgi:starch synthase